MRSLKPQRRHQRQSGFTLIELVIVIVLIGILAAVAIPKFTSLSTDANAAAADGFAGNFSSAAAMNYAMCQGFPTDTNKCKTGITCDMTSLNALVDGAPSDLAIKTGSSLTACTVTKATIDATRAVVIKGT